MVGFWTLFAMTLAGYCIGIGLHGYIKRNR